MEFDYLALKNLRAANSAWRLLCAEQAPLIISFLNAAFIKRGVTYAPESQLAARLKDLMITIEEQYGDHYELSPVEYLMYWSSDKCGFLSRAYIREDSDECFYDITPTTQKALDFLSSLESYEFVGTESRLLQIFDLLKQLNLGAIQDKERYLSDLKAQKAEIEAKIAKAENEGIVENLDDVQIKDRFQQFEQQARTLLSDFRQVEYNFRDLNRSIRQKIELWDDSKGKLIEEVVGQSDFIDRTDQGRSALAFSRLLAQYKQNEMLSDMIDAIYELPEVKEMGFDPNLRHIYKEWLKADERIHYIIGSINKRLKHFVDDKIYLANRTLITAINSFQEKTIALEKIDRSIRDKFFEIELPIFDIQLPMDRRLYELKEKLVLNSQLEEGDIGKTGLDKLYSQKAVDREELYTKLLSALNNREEVSLKEVVERYPLKYGLDELMNYLEVIRLQFDAEIFEDEFEEIAWESTDRDGRPVERRVLMEKTLLRHRN